MDMQRLSEFVAFSKTLNYTNTAKELFIAQSTLSQHISALEAELGLSLVTHNGTPQLTDAGFILASNAESILASLQRTLDLCRKADQDSKSAIRVLDFSGVMNLVQDFFALSNNNSGQNFTITLVPLEGIEGYSEFELLDQGILDVAFYFTESYKPHLAQDPAFDSYEFLPLRPQLSVLQVTANHAFAQKGYITVDEMKTMKIVGTNAKLYETSNKAQIQKLQSAGLELDFVNGPQGSKDRLVMTNPDYAGMVFELDKNTFDKRLLKFVFLEVEGLDFSVQPYAVRRKDNPNPYVHEFMNSWREMIAQNCS